MSRFGRWPPPVAVRRVVTAGPALMILAYHVPLTQALLVGQAILSFGIPFAVIPLFALPADRRIMGPGVTLPRPVEHARTSCAWRGRRSTPLKRRGPQTSQVVP